MDQILELVIIALGSLLTLITPFVARKIMTYFDTKVESASVAKALDYLAAGVQHAWEVKGKELVKAAAAAGSDRKLSDDEKIQLRKLATDFATATGFRDGGMDVVKVLGTDMISHYIAKLVARSKKDGKVPEGS